VKKALFLVLELSILGAACTPSDSSRASAPQPSATTAREATPSASAPRDAKDTDDDVIAKAAQEYLDLIVETQPEKATSLGLHKNDEALNAYTIEAEDKSVEREETMLRALDEKLKNPRASAAARTDLAMLKGALAVDIRVKRVQRPLQRQPDVYVNPLQAIFLMTAREYAPAPERAKKVLARLEKLPKVVEAGRANLLNPPRVWTEIGIEQASSAKQFLDDQRPFLEKALPDDKPRIDAALKGAATAYDDYKKFLQKEVLPRSNGRFSAGRELFEYLLRNDYFLDENSDALLAMGKKVFEETNAQMTAVAKKIDPNAKGWPDVVAKLKANHPTAEGLLDAYRTEVKRARDFIVQKDALELPPGDDLEVIDTPPFMRNVITAAYDQPPPFDQTTKGFFFVTPVDKTLSKAKQEEMLRENDHGDLVDTAVHEAYPGHHLQLSFARRNPSVVRKVLDHAILSEGWALYSEELMAELGYYTDEERLLQLEWTLVRAARVVIDIGLHVGDMTFEQAVKMLTDDVHLERQLAVSEAKRYTTSPTQPLSYLVGRQMIFKMREQYKQRDAAKFSLKKFHADVLQRATVPPSLMAREIFGG
jgi:uncharacterized protein (DUF885 family)